MPRNWWLVCLLAFTLALAACSGKPGAVKTEQPCLVGAWELTNDTADAFFAATLPQGAFEPGSLKYKSGGGSLIYVFRPDGTLDIESFTVQVNYNVQSGADLYDLKLTMGGAARASYKVDGDTIETGPVQQNQISFNASMGTDAMMSSNKAQEFAPLLVTPYTKARFTCTADRLSLQIVNLPGSKGPIEFTRVVSPTPVPGSTGVPTP